MADEETTETEVAVDVAPEAESAETVDAAQADEVAAAPESDAVAEEAAAPAAAAAPAPQPQLTPKERKAQTRARKVAKVATRAQVSPEDRQAERDAARVKKAAERRAGRAAARAKYRAAEHERVATPAREHVAGIQKTRQGVVVSDKADKTITVRIDVARRHRKYQKIVRTSSTVHAHDESNEANIGDTVVVRESRPLSRLKRWRLVEIVERAK